MKCLVCNFKNKLNKEDIIAYNRSLGTVAMKNVRLVLVPSIPFLAYFDKLGYQIGAQDISSFMDKTLTGEVTGEQLKSMGVEYVIVGHSERRSYKHEINIDFINKINNALENDLQVIYCVGETLQEKESGDTFVVLEKQISEVLNNVCLKNITIAYEPVWAIGTGVTSKAEDVKEVVDFLNDLIYEKYDTNINILYGGSISPDNIKEYNNIKRLSGFLVGGASLDVNNVKYMMLEMEV